MKDNFDEKVSELFKFIGEKRIMAAATSADNKVTARSMSVVVYNNRFYFQTDKTSQKAKELRSNPNAALCFDNVSIECICSFKGHPLDAANSAVLELYKKCFENSYKNYSHMINEVFVELTPIRITLWCYEGARPYREFYDFCEKTYKKEYYDNSI